MFIGIHSLSYLLYSTTLGHWVLSSVGPTLSQGATSSGPDVHHGHPGIFVPELHSWTVSFPGLTDNGMSYVPDVQPFLLSLRLHYRESAISGIYASIPVIYLHRASD